MREIIQLSFGKESNHLQTHFWNFEDEKLKASVHGEQNAIEAQSSSEAASVLYYEQPSTG